jgi:toxin CcdB
MARFDVYANPDARERTTVPYLLDVQNTYVEVETRVVVPLCMRKRFQGQVPGLNPELSVRGDAVIMNTSALGAIPESELHRPVDNLASSQSMIQEALDILFGGY